MATVINRSGPAVTEPDKDETRVLNTGTHSTARAQPGAADNALPIGTRLSNEFEIVGLVGQGGFGIVYLADDHSLQRRVAVKEYMPASLAMRGGDASVVLRSERHADTFEIGLRSFVNEARLLARFDHPALLKVFRFWEANGTAYMAMPYYAGETLKDWLKQQTAPPDEAAIRRILLPVMDALELLHRENCFHRDIAPDNIMLLPDGRPVLLDFGAARRVIGDMTQALTVILKPGYAPIEQYAEMPGVRQGAWTDIYALGALVHYMITGHTPPPSVGRMMNDSYEPLAVLAAGRYSDAFLRGIDRCLAIRSEDRPQSIAEMRALIGFATPSTPAPSPETASQDGATIVLPPGNGAARTAAGDLRTAETAPAVTPAKPLARWISAIGGALLAGGAALWWLLKPAPDRPQDRPVAARIEAARPANQAGTPPSAPVMSAPPTNEAPAPLAAAPPERPEVIGLSISTPNGGTRFSQGQAISIRVRPDRTSYLYCFMQDESGAIQRFFPNRFKADARVGADGIALPGQMKFRINANFKGGPEAIACIASAADLQAAPLIRHGDFAALKVASLDDLRTELALTAGPGMGVARLDLLRR